MEILYSYDHLDATCGSLTSYSQLLVICDMPCTHSKGTGHPSGIQSILLLFYHGARSKFGKNICIADCASNPNSKGISLLNNWAGASPVDVNGERACSRQREKIMFCVQMHNICTQQLYLHTQQLPWIPECPTLSRRNSLSNPWAPTPKKYF